MENVSHLFLFKGKLQTESSSPPSVVSPSHTTPCHGNAYQNQGFLTRPASLLLLPSSVRKGVAPSFCAYN